MVKGLDSISNMWRNKKLPRLSSHILSESVKGNQRVAKPPYVFNRRPFKSSGASLEARQHQHQHQQLPLSGIRVLDLTRVLAGPWCTQLMADMGADVIKVEQPSTGGDETRRWRLEGEGSVWKEEEGKSFSLYFAAVNRNKRSLTLDLKSSKGKEIIWKMIRSGVDVVTNNFLPGTMDRLGLGYDEIKAFNKGIIYASVSGYGPNGPNVKRAGYDAIALAEAGLLHITGEPNGPPTKPGVAIADLCTGLYTYGAIAAALRSREVNGGDGYKIDGSLFESSLSLLINVGMGAINVSLQAP